MYLQAAWSMVERAAALYDQGAACGAEAKTAKLPAARAGHDAAWHPLTGRFPDK